MSAATITVQVVYAEAERQHLIQLELATGATVRDALLAAQGHPGFAMVALETELDAGRVGVYGERVGGDRVLVGGDRVEIYRPLQADPKDARRLRALKQSSR